MEQKQSSYIKEGQLFEKDDEYDDKILFWADFKKGCVYINCECYYSMPFDAFIEFADFIKKEREKAGEYEY